MKKNNYDVIRNRLEYARKNKNLSLEEVGKALKVHKTTVSRWEKGQTEKIQLPVFEMLAKLYNVNAMWLMGYDVPMYIQSQSLEDKLLKLGKYMEENNLTQINLIPIYDQINLNSNWKNNPTGYTPFDAKIQGCPEDKSYFYYKISNNNMNIEKNSYILIEDTADIDINDIILYSIDNKNIELGIYKLNLKQEKNFVILGKYIK